MRVVGCLFLLLCLTACLPASERSPTATEKTLFTILDKMEWGMGWDRHCVGLERDVDSYLYKNVQQLILQLGEELAQQLPEGSSEKKRDAHMQGKLDTHIDDLRPSIDALFEKESCASKNKEIVDAKRAYDMFATNPPRKMNIVIRQQVDRAIESEK